MKILPAASLLCAACACFASTAARADGGYLGFHGLAGFADQSGVERSPAQAAALDDETDNSGVNGGLGLWAGYDWSGSGTPVRAELSATWRYRHDLNVYYDVPAGPNPGQYAMKADIGVVDVMASVSYVFDHGGKWHPYLGAGVGVALSDVDSYVLYGNTRTSGQGESGSEFAWQVHGGLAYELGDDWEFRMEYRYIDLGTVATGTQVTGDRFEVDLASHDFRIGFSRRF